MFSTVTYISAHLCVHAPLSVHLSGMAVNLLYVVITY